MNLSKYISIKCLRATPSGRVIRAGPAILALIMAGCGSQPWGNDTRPLGREAAIAESSHWRPLGPAEPAAGRSEELEQILREVASPHLTGDQTPVLTAAPKRGRWSDVKSALSRSIDEDGVEMGILRALSFEWGSVFELKTVEGWPARLIVTRMDDRRVYEATAEVGRFPDLPERRARARKLEAAFEKWMRVLGAKPRPIDTDE